MYFLPLRISKNILRIYKTCRYYSLNNRAPFNNLSSVSGTSFQDDCCSYCRGTKYIKCISCNGDMFSQNCTYCKDTKFIKCISCNIGGIFHQDDCCPYCRSTKYIKCISCNGVGKIYFDGCKEMICDDCRGNGNKCKYCGSNDFINTL